MPKVETTWRLDVDTDTGRAKFEVEYHSDLPPAQHETIHKALCEQAKQLLRTLGIENPDWGRVKEGVVTITNSANRVNANYEVRVQEEKS